MARPSKNAIEARKRRLLESQQRRLSRDLDRVSARLESCMACSVEKAEKEYARVEARAEAERRALEKRLGVSLADLRGSKKTAKKATKKTAKKTAKKAAKKVSAKSVEAPATAKKTAKKASKKAAKKASRASSEPSPAPRAEAELEIRVGAPVAEAPVRLPPTRAPKSRVKPTAEGSSAPKARKGKLTYAQARAAILESIRSAGGWSTNPLLKVPHATAPGGRIRFYFRPRAIYADYAASASKPQFSLNSARSLVSEGEVLALAQSGDPAARLLQWAAPGQKDLF